MSPGVTPAQVDFYVKLLDKVVQTPDWHQFMDQGAFNETVMTGPAFKTWLEAAEKQHAELMKEAGFLAASK
jgi:putative tricarboxylic transport membrane protein